MYWRKSWQALSMILRKPIKKCGLTLNVHAFLIYMTMQDVGVMESGLKPAISQTYIVIS